MEQGKVSIGAVYQCSYLLYCGKHIMTYQIRTASHTSQQKKDRKEDDGQIATIAERRPMQGHMLSLPDNKQKATEYTDRLSTY